ncbi:hypothetical protein KC222_00635 [Cedecea davisae]|uniref:Lipoprotein n=1 Tax=Cedecea davisae TaxID=158484 RepID=A0ABS6DBE7_9ENTR|nr:hypothetical protein [Cedecea davisae]MBU4680518.1 hypothetical protein [Cedecea davisae]MBU4685010.1 hypothetical protein [Cedecea davisae]
MMKMPIGKILAAFLLPASMVISGCQVPGKFITDEGKTKTLRLQCESNMEPIAANLPAELYQRMNRCIESQDWDDATFLYALAGSKTWYDAMRVDSQYAHAMHSRLLRESIDSLTDLQKTAFWDNIQRNMNDRQKKDMLCRRVKEAGMPDYQPNYMFIEPFKVSSFTFSNKVSWKSAVNRYLEC